jgi:hypothetical protein
MHYWKKIGIIALVPLALTACSGKNILNSLNVGIRSQNQETDLELSAVVNLGNLNLEEIQIPVLDPKTQTKLGIIGFTTNPSGGQRISLVINASSLIHANLELGTTLPNGRPLPSSLGLGTQGALAIPVLNSSRVYIGGDLKSKLILGIALTLPEMDSVTSRIPVNSNIFFRHAFTSELMGIAGIYSSPDPHQSGIAVFGQFTPTQGLNLATQVRSRIIFRSQTQSENPNNRDRTVLSPSDQIKLLNFFQGPRRTLIVD